MRKEEVNWSTIERVHPPDQPFVPPEQGVLKHNERLLLPSVRTRALIIKFAKKQPDPLTEPEWKELKEALGRQCAPLLALLKDLRKDEKSRLHPLPITLYSFPGAWKNFLSVIGSPISMVWVFRPAVVGLLQHLMVTKKYTLEADQALSAYCPPLATALRSLQDYVLQPLHAELIQKGVDVVRKCYPDLPDTPVAPAVLAQITASVKEGLEGSVELTKKADANLSVLKTQIQQKLPSLWICDQSVLENETIIPEADCTLTGSVWSFPKIRTLQRYEGIDPPTASEKQWSDIVVDQPDSSKESSVQGEISIVCTKEEARSQSTRKHTAGLFIECCPYEVAYGFQEMVEHKGRKHLLKLLVERQLQQVLNQLHVLYDFSCQEAEYMMNRLPELFKHTRLFID